MQQYSIPSLFQSLPVEIYWYPSKNTSSQHVVLLLKGLYGLHIPNSEASWDTQLIPSINNDAHVVCINAARKGEGNESRSSKEAFVGKTFAQECDDIRRAYQYLKDKQVIPEHHTLSVVGNSFGGTTLLGIPSLLQEASSVIMIGSGCGKSATTTKPLLATLPDEEILLQPLRSYGGVFAFVRGEMDTVAPKASQEKIMESATSARVNLRYTIAHALHDLTSETKAVNRTSLLASVIKHLYAFTEDKK